MAMRHGLLFGAPGRGARRGRRTARTPSSALTLRGLHRSDAPGGSGGPARPRPGGSPRLLRRPPESLYSAAPMAKIKMKSNSSAKKRFKLTAKGRVKRKKAYLRHCLDAQDVLGASASCAAAAYSARRRSIRSKRCSRTPSPLRTLRKRRKGIRSHASRQRWITSPVIAGTASQAREGLPRRPVEALEGSRRGRPPQVALRAVSPPQAQAGLPRPLDHRASTRPRASSASRTRG